MIANVLCFILGGTVGVFAMAAFSYWRKEDNEVSQPVVERRAPVEPVFALPKDMAPVVVDSVLFVGRHKWKVRFAVSMAHAEHAIAMAQCTGSVGSKHYENDELHADVVRLNEDGSECQPN